MIIVFNINTNTQKECLSVKFIKLLRTVVCVAWEEGYQLPQNSINNKNGLICKTTSQYKQKNEGMRIKCSMNNPMTAE